MWVEGLLVVMGNEDLLWQQASYGCGGGGRSAGAARGGGSGLSVWPDVALLDDGHVLSKFKLGQ